MKSEETTHVVLIFPQIRVWTFDQKSQGGILHIWYKGLNLSFYDQWDDDKNSPRIRQVVSDAKMQGQLDMNRFTLIDTHARTHAYIKICTETDS